MPLTFAPPSDAFVLGAGFSMAIGRPMLSTEDLGQRVLATQRSIHEGHVRTHSAICDGLSCDYPILSRGALPAADFEAWLSALAESQPYLLSPENDRRRALFSELKGLIALVVTAAVETTVARQEPPQWLETLVETWNEKRAELVTFNYDTLVEATVDHLNLAAPYPPDGGPQRLTYQVVGPSVFPSFQMMYGGLRLPPADSFRYRKLHGSTHWYWDEMTHAADSMVEVGLRSHWNDVAPEYSDEELHQYRAPGKEPMIVPPTTIKSIYFDNPAIRFLWHDAYKALLAARRVFVIGYSLPRADLLVRSMLTDSLEDTEIWIVNPDEGVGERFEELGVGALNREFCGRDGDLMVEFVDRYRAL